MAKLKLEPDERLIGSGQVALQEKQLIGTQATAGDICVTNRRVCFQVRMIGTVEMDLPLDEIAGFSVGRLGPFTKVTIQSTAGKSWAFTGFPIKKLQEWLRQAGVAEL